MAGQGDLCPALPGFPGTEIPSPGSFSHILAGLDLSSRIRGRCRIRGISLGEFLAFMGSSINLTRAGPACTKPPSSCLFPLFPGQGRAFSPRKTPLEEGEAWQGWHNEVIVTESPGAALCPLRSLQSRWGHNSIPAGIPVTPFPKLAAPKRQEFHGFAPLHSAWMELSSLLDGIPQFPPFLAGR